MRDPSTGPSLTSSLVEFPVLGYQPPASLTEMHFQLFQCGLELAPPDVTPFRIAFLLGIFCSPLDTMAGASVSISVEGATVHLNKDSMSPIDSTVCLADIDYLDLSVTLSEPERDHLYVQGPAFLSLGPLEHTLLVTASANLVRVWTCANTLQLLAKLKYLILILLWGSRVRTCFLILKMQWWN